MQSNLLREISLFAYRQCRHFHKIAMAPLCIGRRSQTVLIPGFTHWLKSGGGSTCFPIIAWCTEYIKARGLFVLILYMDNLTVIESMSKQWVPSGSVPCFFAWSLPYKPSRTKMPQDWEQHKRNSFLLLLSLSASLEKTALPKMWIPNLCKCLRRHLSPWSHLAKSLGDNTSRLVPLQVQKRWCRIGGRPKWQMLDSSPDLHSKSVSSILPKLRKMRAKILNHARWSVKKFAWKGLGK